jgi:hypothetical protein
MSSILKSKHLFQYSQEHWNRYRTAFRPWCYRTSAVRAIRNKGEPAWPVYIISSANPSRVRSGLAFTRSLPAAGECKIL